MTLVKLRCAKLYWRQNNPETGFSYPCIKSMSRDRFMVIWGHLHFADNAKAIPPGFPGFDKVFKLREFITILNAAFAKNYRLGNHVSVDEAMVGYKGRTYLRQYGKTPSITNWSQNIEKN